MINNKLILLLKPGIKQELRLGVDDVNRPKHF